MSNSFFKVNKGINLSPQTSTPTNPLEGDIYFDSTQNTLKQYANGAWSSVGSGSGISPWTTSTAYTVNQNVMYNDRIYRCISAHTSSSSSFSADFIANKWVIVSDNQNIMKIGDTFETNDSSGWLTGTISGYTAGTFPTGSMTLVSAPTASGTNALSGRYSLVNVQSVAGSFMRSPIITIDKSNSGRMLTYSFDYWFATGATGVDLNGTSTASFHVVLWDDTNSEWVQPTNTYGINSIKGSWTGQAQLKDTCTSVLIVILTANTCTNNSPRFDNFKVSRDGGSTGPIITDWQSYTPTLTGFGTATNIEFQQRRVGADLEIRGRFTAGTTTAVEARLSLPSGLTSANTSVIPSISFVGEYIRNDTTAGPGTWTILAEPSTQYVTFGLFNGSFGGLSKLNGSNITASASVIAVKAKIPIQGWSSNVTLSSSNSNKQIVFVGYKTSTQAATADVTDLAYTAQKDSSGAWNGTQFVAQEPGDYLLTLGGSSSAATTMKVYLNGSLYKQLLDFNSTANNSGAVIVYGVLAGQTISIRSGSSVNINAGVSTSPATLTIYKLANPQTIAASDTISAIYTDISGATLQTSQTVFKYTTRVRDTHSAYNTSTGIFTAPEPGLYRISYTLASSGASSLSTSQRFASYIVANGTQITGTKMMGNGVATSLFTTQSVEYPLLAGQTLQIQAAIDVSQVALSSAGFNILSITRVGN